MIKKFLIALAPLADLFLLPFVFVSGSVLKTYRWLGSIRLPANTKLLKKLGVFPIRDHYYEPLFNHKHLKRSLGTKRLLPGIDFRKDQQIALLAKLNYQREFEKFLESQASLDADLGFKLGNRNFGSGDAEFLFNFIRHTKPSSVIEIGCGSSTKVIQHALSLNQEETLSGSAHICVEPYENPWLERFQRIQLVRDKVEDVELSLFQSLKENDLLFIDSSHMIRPQGDVLREYLEIIPSLPKGVFVHVHDIFSPFDYPESWIVDRVNFWNEQYLLEATLSNSTSYQVVAALHYLKQEEFDSLKKVCPYLTEQRDPGSFYFRKV